MGWKSRRVNELGEPRWSVLTYREIEDASDPDEVYLRRWTILGTPWGSLKLHNIRMPDGDRALHDHPWSFASFIIAGGYIEERLTLGVHEWPREVRDLYVRRPRSIHRMPCDGAHRIRELLGPCWTLVVTGPFRRVWGFYPEPGVWVPHDRYLEWLAAREAA